METTAEATQQQGHERTVTVIVNGQPKSVNTKELTFEQVVSLAYHGNPPSGPNWAFTVGYRRGEGNKPSGTLVTGESVKVKEGMIFDVTGTDKS